MPNTPYQTDGDSGFVGMASRDNPVNIQPGFVQFAKNIRMDRGNAAVRSGCKDLTLPSLITGSVNFRVSCDFLATDGTEYIILIANDGLYTYNTSTGNTSTKFAFPSRTISGTTYVRDIDASDPCDAFQAADKVYILRGYSRNSVFDISSGANTISRLGTTVTLNFYTTNPGYSVGDEIIVYCPGHQDMSGSYFVESATFDGTNYKVTYTTVASGNKSHTTFTCVEAKAALVWNGSTVSVVDQATATQYPYLEGGDDVCMPPADFGMYFQGRIVLCVSRDEIAASNYYEPNIFDVTLDQFRINTGANDYIVGFEAFQEDKFLIFQRNSIYYAFLPPPAIAASIDRGISADSFIQTLTNQFGCSARRSIQLAGQQVFFLSDRGVYQLSHTLDLKLIGDQRPLSEPISDLINRINANTVSGSCGLFWNNRYYLAVPMDGSTGNNAILVYSLLNQAWESMDTYPVQMQPKNMLQALNQNSKRMYAIAGSRYFLLEETSADQVNDGTGTPVLGVAQLGSNDPLNPSISAVFTQGSLNIPMDGQILSRRYNFKTFDEKRFSGLQSDFVLNQGDDVTVSVVISNPDSTSQLIRFTSQADEDKTLRTRIARRGYAADILFQSNAGRPVLRSYAIDATVAGRNLVSAE
jgi:hypothetical protein